MSNISEGEKGELTSQAIIKKKITAKLELLIQKNSTTIMND